MFSAISNYFSQITNGMTVNVKGKSARWTKLKNLKPGAKICITGDEISPSEVMFDEILEIKHIGREQVYDIEVEDTHNFVGNGIIAHNTYINNANVVEAIQEQQIEINNMISLLNGLSFASDGTLNIPKLQADHLTISADSVSGLNISSNNGSLVYNTANALDVLATLQTIDQKLADVQNTVASQSAVIASNSEAISTTKSALDSLKDTIASLSSQIASSSSTPRNDTALNLTSPDILLATNSATLTTNYQLLTTSEATISGQLSAYQATISDTFKALGNSFLGNTTVAGDFSVDGTLSLTGSSLSNLSTLYIQNGPLATLVDFFNGLVTIDNKGILTIQKLSVSNKTLSTATIPLGQTQVVVTTNQLTPTSKIFLSPHQPVAAAVIAKDPTAGTFTIELGQPQGQDLEVDWWIVDSK